MKTLFDVLDKCSFRGITPGELTWVLKSDVYKVSVSALWEGGNWAMLLSVKIRSLFRSLSGWGGL